MAEFAIAQDGHAWNNSLAHATFEDNVAIHGKETALKYLRQDIRSWISERKNESHQWSLYVRDGRMITETGVSLDEMTSNITNGPHSDLVPETIKATALLEAATLEEATRLAAMGASRIILPEQHKDASGNIVSRYLSVWTKSASDSTRFDGTRIDLGKNVPVEDVRTGSSFAAFQHEGAVTFHQHGAQKQAFVLEIKDGGGKPFEIVEKVIVTSIHRSHQETYPREIRPTTEASDTSLVTNRHSRPERPVDSYVQKEDGRNTNIFIDAPRAVFRDTAETMRGVAVFLREKQQQRERVAYTTEKPGERLTLEKIREKSVRMVEVIEKRHGEMKKEVVTVKLIAETGIAVHAAPFILAALTENPPPLIRAVEKSLRRHEKRELRMKNHELRMIKQEMRSNRRKDKTLHAGVGEIVTPSTEWKKKKKRRKEYVEVMADGRRYTLAERMVRKEQGRRVKREKVIGVSPRRAVAEKLTPIVTKGLERREKRRLRRAVEKSMRRRRKKELRMKKYELRRKVKREIQKDSVKVQPLKTERVEPLKERKRSTKKNERAAVAGMWFAWMVWIKLVRKDADTAKSTFIRHRLASQDDVLQDKEETPWILLSIIYYLTAIREQGMQSNPTNPTNTPIRPIKNARVIPKHAVIFAYNS